MFNCSLFIFITYFINIYNILLLFISIDNFSYAIDFIINILKSKYNKIDNHKQIIIKNNNLYLGTSYEKYVFYIILYIFYNLLYYFVTQNIIIKYCTCFLIIPDIYNQIYLKYNNYFDIVSSYRNYILKIFLAEQVTNIIKFLSKKYIDDINIDKEHIKLTLIENEMLIPETYLFIKNFLIVLLMMYFRSKSILYYKIIKYIYIYNSGKYYITNIDLEKCKIDLQQIILEKKYNKLNEPQLIQSMLYLYYSKNDDQFEILTQKLNYNIIEFFTLWTLGSFFNDIYRILILIILWLGFSFSFNLFCTDIKYKDFSIIFYKKFIPIFITISIYLFSSNIIILSFAIQFLNSIIFNRITKSFYNTIYNNINNSIMKNRIIIFKILHENITPFIKYYLFAFILKYILYKNKIQYIHYTCIFWMFITNIDKDLYSNYLYLILYLSVINKNNIYKIITLSYILSLINNFIKWKINDTNIFTYKDISNNISNHIINLYSRIKLTFNKNKSNQNNHNSESIDDLIQNDLIQNNITMYIRDAMSDDELLTKTNETNEINEINEIDEMEMIENDLQNDL